MRATPRIARTRRIFAQIKTTEQIANVHVWSVTFLPTKRHFRSLNERSGCAFDFGFKGRGCAFVFNVTVDVAARLGRKLETEKQ